MARRARTAWTCCRPTTARSPAALGAQGADVSTAEGLAGALQRFAAAGKPALVNVMIERAAAPRY